MSDQRDSLMRVRTLQLIVLLVVGAIVGRLFYIQLIDDRYKDMAANNALRHVVQYPPRGEVRDRNGEFIVQSREAYDLMVIAREIPKEGFDTMRMCRVLGMEKAELIKQLTRAKTRSRVPMMITNQLSKEVKLRFDECNFRGFYTVYRTIRSYPRRIGGNLMGYVGEINAEQLRKRPEYRAGDYIGISGLESAYEEVLRGKKGVKINEIDNHGVIKGSFRDGMYDSLPIPGRSLVCTIDAELQELAEELMEGKVGSVVAIEPSTGEILLMVSSPTYDPNDLVGKNLRLNYNKLLRNPQRPLYNRAVSSHYPPGSTFKLVQGLIGLQEGVLKPSYRYPCAGGYTYAAGRKMKCHPHPSPLDLRAAVANSCNAYFCYVFRDIIDNKKYENVKAGLDVWTDYVRSFGFGRTLDSDFANETRGYVPTSEFYNRVYRNSWKSQTIISLSIGQGELGCTPLQMANLAAIIANRGYYYIPHIVRSVEGVDSLEQRFYEKQYTKVDAEHFEPIVEGMWQGVNVAGTSTRAAVAGLDICGKTGTAQNPHGRDHSTFLSFAPKDDPKIAISVYVENGGFGATIALPIASLLIEKYLTDTITRPYMIDQVKQMKIHYPNAKK
ncbi:MAG: penicillin-binding protein 2 [Rikenellaceae bacterium]|nr:penicillin-binding protein 2 [Rikenellaceae bacterium]MBQ3254690.1 penicillin-binding protein 2 [Rikenellaceae bacterium]MBQ6690313.1 penicillin-binding protein 2 [Rikenellaceae bacterium]MBQ8744934.1 penicillin-binding protein 2 [Rikenellaceae bacterium]MBR2501609.1 penicillin-binding protein 2 [Rikenellaceae bacterium]